MPSARAPAGLRTALFQGLDHDAPILRPVLPGLVVHEGLGIAVRDHGHAVQGHAHLIDAVHRLSAEKMPAKLLIVGAGPQEETLKRKVRQLGMDDCVRMTGYRADVPRLIGAMDCCVLPATKNEATSQALPQALRRSAARPVISFSSLEARSSEPGVSMSDRCEATSWRRAVDGP